MPRPTRLAVPEHPAPRRAPVRAGRRTLGWRLLRWGFIGTIWGSLGLAAALLWFAWDLPRPEAALDAARRPGMTLEDRSGHVFATFGDLVGESLRLSDVPRYLPAAVVAVEDRRFWSHPGIDVMGVGRAMLTNLGAGRVVQGGSTITQQVAKTLFLTNARTLRRKVQEVLLSLWLERSFSKKEILEIWLNRVYLGSGAWGVDAAARLYFGVSARRLSLWQAAVIAGLPRAPSRFNPRVNPSAAAARGKEVLEAMAETGAISAAEAERAAAHIEFPPHPATGAVWYADWAAEQAALVLPRDQDATLRTTLDARIQGVAETRLAAMLDGPGAASGVGQGAVVVLDAASGAVRAMVGGRDARGSGFNRAVQARRQPGSSFKPFVWLAALEKGVRPDDMVLDAPVRVGGYSPANFEHRYLGEITVEEALAQSINTAAVRLMIEAGGPRAVGAVARRLGMSEQFPNNASLALGTSEVGLLELSSAYAAFFNGGIRVAPYAIESFRSGRRVVATGHAIPERVIEPEEAAMMARMLGAVVRTGSGRAAAVPGAVVAGKTGTTQDYRDAWFIGAVGGTVIGVWLGNDDNRPMRGVTGGSLPARLFGEIAASVKAD
ncbi:MAG TPA: PBP1A family penicillin-binding protein [Acetobacteraceae bacterium]|nr:PBP1A family penicillin-binding protein [Acetobacteraceae bacterium]